MAIAPIFNGKVDDDGLLMLVEAEKVRRRAYLKTLVGHEVEIVIRRRRTKRSLKQNNYIHLAATLLAEEFGNELDEMKLILMGEKWGWRYSEAFGREIPVKPHTSSMTVEESTEFIDWLPRWAMTNHNIHLPLPGEAEL